MMLRNMMMRIAIASELYSACTPLRCSMVGVKRLLSKQMPARFTRMAEARSVASAVL